MISAFWRSASSTIAAPGLRVRIRRVCTLSPALRPASFALSSTLRPSCSSSCRPASSESWLGTRRMYTASTVAPSPTSLAAARRAEASTSVPKIGTIAEWYSSSMKKAGRARCSIR